MNLTKTKALLFSLTAALMIVGYAASQWFAFTSRAAVYARAVDVPSVSLLALVIICAFVALAFQKEAPAP